MKKKKFILILLGALLLLAINNPFVFPSDSEKTSIDWMCIGKPSCVSVLATCGLQPISLVETNLAWVIIRGYPKVSFGRPLYVGKLPHYSFLCTALKGKDADSYPLLEILYIGMKGESSGK